MANAIGYLQIQLAKLLIIDWTIGCLLKQLEIEVLSMKLQTVLGSVQAIDPFKFPISGYRFSVQPSSMDVAIW